MKLYANEASYKMLIHQNRRDLPYLLFLHGYMGSSGVFEPIVNRIQDLCNPVTVDLLGHGETFLTGKVTSDRFSAENQVQDILSILKRLKLPDLFLYGYSMGGRLAQQLLAFDVSHFSGVILESTHCGISDSEARSQRRKMDGERAGQIEKNFEDFVDKWIQLPLFESSQPMETKYEGIIRKQSPTYMAASIRGFGAGVMPPICDTIKSLELPIGLIAGKMDQKYVDKMGEMAQLLSNASIEIISNAGHRVHADRPDQIVKLITKFLNSYG